jgi:hypothetical protein
MRYPALISRKWLTSFGNRYTDMHIASLQLRPRAKAFPATRRRVVAGPSRRRQRLRMATLFPKTARPLAISSTRPSTPPSPSPLHFRRPQRIPSLLPSPRPILPSQRPLRRSHYPSRTSSLPRPHRSMMTRAPTSRTAASQVPRSNSLDTRSASILSAPSQRSRPTQTTRRSCINPRSSHRQMTMGGLLCQ